MTDKISPAVDLDSMTVPELRALASAATVKAQDKTETAKQAVLDETRAKLKELGVDFNDLLKTPPSKTAKLGNGKVPVKYRGPMGQNWSGRGKLPQWVADAEQRGQKRDEFKV